MESISTKDVYSLQSGANEHQSAKVYTTENSLDYEILSRNKNLEYIDYLNLSEAVRILGEFFDVNATVIVNESHICSVALGSTIEEAYIKAIDCDPISIFGGCAGFSKELTFETAKQLNAMKIKNVISPSFSKEAFSYLLDTDINIIKINTPLHEVVGFSDKDIKTTPFGILVQEQNHSTLSKESFAVVTQTKPSQQQAEDAIFAWKVSKHLKSKSAIIVKDLCTKAIVQNATNTVFAVETAMDKSCENSKEAVLSIDSAIDNSQTINAAIQGRIGLIIESGDSKNSQNILKLADKYAISMIFTKIRNNKY